ncbi:hypothetical protein Avbf_08935 [Armadillidium vulgare]|nr:hypothetical protein Avbf_08935 [Armadillidium vulgare]
MDIFISYNDGKILSWKTNKNTCTVQGQEICLNCQTVALCDEDEDNPGTFTTRNSTQSSCSPGDGNYNMEEANSPYVKLGTLFPNIFQGHTTLNRKNIKSKRFGKERK